MNADDDSGAAIAAFIGTELENERKRRAGLESRGVALITTSSSFCTLLLAVAALVLDQQAGRPSLGTIVAVVVAVGLFAAAGIAGILAARARWYSVADVQTVDELLGDRWSVDLDTARRAVATINRNTLASLRDGNDKMASAAALGGWLQVAAVAALALGLALQIVLMS